MTLLRTAVVLLAVATGSALAQSGPMGDGEVRKVDKDAQKITVRHGPLPDRACVRR